MTMNKPQVMAMLQAPMDSSSMKVDFNAAGSNIKELMAANYSVGDSSLGKSWKVGDDIKTNAVYQKGEINLSAYRFWQDEYYPRIIKELYPVYLQERARDKGKQAFEIIKVLKDKKVINLKKIGDFIDLMDELIKIL